MGYFAQDYAANVAEICGGRSIGSSRCGGTSLQRRRNESEFGFVGRERDECCGGARGAGCVSGNIRSHRAGKVGWKCLNEVDAARGGYGFGFVSEHGGRNCGARDELWKFCARGYGS